MAHHETNYLKPKFYLLLHMMSVNVSMCTMVHMPRSEDKLLSQFSPSTFYVGSRHQTQTTQVYAASTFTPAPSHYLSSCLSEKKGVGKWRGGNK